MLSQTRFARVVSLKLQVSRRKDGSDRSPLVTCNSRLATKRQQPAIILPMHIKAKKLVVLLTLLALASCGFTLRGSANIPPQLQNLVLVSSNENSDIMQELRRALQANKVNILDMTSADSYQLLIGEAEIQERILSVNSNARAGEFELSISVPFQLRSSNTVALEPEVLTLEKVYLADPNSAVAKAEERELMETEIRRELVSLILRRLQNAEL